MSPGLTVGTEVMLSSSLMWGWLACVRRGPKKPLSPAKIPGNSGVEMSGTDGSELMTVLPDAQLTKFPVVGFERIIGNECFFCAEEWPQDEIGV